MRADEKKILDLLEFAQKNMLQWGNADLLAPGPDKNLERVSHLAIVASLWTRKSGERQAAAVWLILPPNHNAPPEETLSRLSDSVALAMREISDGKATDTHITEAFSFLTLISTPNFDSSNLVALLAQASKHTAIIVLQARHYRAAGLNSDDGSEIDEDVWTQHLGNLIGRAEAIAKERGSYILLDLGGYFPSRAENMEILMAVGDVGVFGNEPPGRPADQIICQVGEIYNAAASGDIGIAIFQIETADDMSDRQKFFLKLETYSTAKLTDKVQELLEQTKPTLTDLSADQAINVARIAETADADDFAEILLRQALPELRNERQFRYAFETALKIGRGALVSNLATAFFRYFPQSPMLVSYQVSEHVRLGNYDIAAKMLANSTVQSDIEDCRYYALLSELTRPLDWAADCVLSTIEDAMPTRSEEVLKDVAAILERQDARLEAICLFENRRTSLTSSQILTYARLLRHALQVGELATEDAMVEKFTDVALDYLAGHPDAGPVRVALTRVLSPSILASDGIPILIAALLKRAEPMQRIRSRPPFDRRPLPLDPRLTMSELTRIWIKLNDQGKGIVQAGKVTLAAKDISQPPEQIIAGILDLVDYQGKRITDQVDVNLMSMYVGAACAIAHQSPEPDDDLIVLRVAGSRLAISGKGQQARDFAEFALSIAKDRPERRRRALFTFADIYARLGMKLEALIALAAGYGASGTVTWDDVWFETNLLFRLMRDLNLLPFALPFVDRSRQALEELGVTQQESYKLDTLFLQARTMRFDLETDDSAELIELIGLAIENAESALTRNHDVLPIAMVLNNLLLGARERDLAEAKALTETLAQIAEILPASQQQYIRATGPDPLIADIATLVATMDQPRYAVDAGYDLRNVRIMAQRAVRGAVTEVNPAAMMYAIEAAADHGLSVTKTDGSVVQGERLLACADAPNKAAELLSQGTISVVGMGLLDETLAVVRYDSGTVFDFTLETGDVFSASALSKWTKRFPKDYMLDDSRLTQEEVRSSVANLGLSALPPRLVIVSSANLHRLPANLLTVGRNYAGFAHAISTTPSLEWLSRSRLLNRQGDGAARMWVPTINGAGNATLTLMREDIDDVLVSNDVHLEYGPLPSLDFANIDVAIIGAHGGLADANRYFRSVANDNDEVTEISDLTNITRHARLTILFVCSAGRVDPSPETGDVIGLSKHVLARGCSAVIAPAWPIPFTIVRTWLAAFLPAWRAGDLLIDAYHKGNMAVANSTSWDAKRALAMTLYGDPFIRTSLANAESE
ncbi:hypothetical protein Q1W73_13565 [Asticcacaulis sp. ZE23SCel15]|uniref:hypothetical protein n=1 Tax=Asticcacaulis sp. ZE23SCel15 TaxID=3059027 RepID=UPI00265F5957|nr:hypothetical protein [Asticcacaulis sp. ZE23SCel15]WKL56688.1 hypothetical protein Q1W73_13565 [Asticcacaulis sp. ZE23SCel15]